LQCLSFNLSRDVRQPGGTVNCRMQAAGCGYSKKSVICFRPDQPVSGLGFPDIACSMEGTVDDREEGMTERTYCTPEGGLPDQTRLLTGRAVFTEAYAVIPRGVMRDIVTSCLPLWDGTRVWVLARPMSGFAETFSHYIAEVAPGGGSSLPEPDAGAEGALFMTAGEAEISLPGQTHVLREGGYAYLPPGSGWTLRNRSGVNTCFHWIRKTYEAVEGIETPGPVFANDRDTVPDPMPDARGVWETTRFVDPGDMRHDMHVGIVTLRPGGSIPFMETHVMEHGIYVLEGKAAYRLNRDWVEVEAGDYMCLRAFCPQACYAGGPGPFRYLLYKDVNRHMTLTPRPGSVS